MDDAEKVIWQMLSSVGGAAMYMSDDNIYVALVEGLIIIPNPKASMQWGYTDDGEVTGVYTFKPARG